MENLSCHGCGKRKAKLVFCEKSGKYSCKDCCISTVKIIGKCPFWDLCW